MDWEEGGGDYALQVHWSSRFSVVECQNLAKTAQNGSCSVTLVCQTNLADTAVSKFFNYRELGNTYAF